MGLLVNIRESWADFLRGDTQAGIDSGAGAFFSPGEDADLLPIHIFTEKLKSIEEKLTDAQKLRGLSVVIATISARGAVNNIPGGYQFSKIIAVARVFESPKTNLIGIPCSDVAEAVAWFTRKFTMPGVDVLKLQDIALAPDSGRKDALAYDVIYTVEGNLTAAPTR